MQNNYKKIYQIILLIVIFGLIIYSKYPYQGGVIIYGDIQQSHIFGGEAFGYYLKYFNGDTNLQWFMHPIFELYIIIIQFIFNNESIISKIYIFSSYLILYLSVFKYCKYKTNNYYYSLALAIFSISHPIIDTYHSNILVIYSFGFFIASCFALQNLIDKKINKYIFYIYLALYSLSLIYIQYIPFYIFIYLIIILLNKNKIPNISEAIEYLIKFILLNVMIIMPLILNILLNTELIQNISNQDDNYNLALDSSRVLGNIFGSIIGVPYTSYNQSSPTSLFTGYDKPSIYLFPLILFIYTYIFYSIYSTKNKYLPIIIISVVTAAILSVGPYHNINFLFDFLWNFLPGFTTFRSWVKFSSIYYLLIILLLINLKLCTSDYFILAFILPLMFVPTFAWSRHDYVKELRASYALPLSYSKIKNREDLGRTLVVPQYGWLTAYTWRKNNKVDYPNDTENFVLNNGNASFLYSGANYYRSGLKNYINTSLYLMLINNDIKSFMDLSKIFNVQSIIYQKDILEVLNFKNEQYSYINSGLISLESRRSISILDNNENYEIYRIDNGLNRFIRKSNCALSDQFSSVILESKFENYKNIPKFLSNDFKEIINYSKNNNSCVQDIGTESSFVEKLSFFNNILSTDLHPGNYNVYLNYKLPILIYKDGFSFDRIKTNDSSLRLEIKDQGRFYIVNGLFFIIFMIEVALLALLFLPKVFFTYLACIFQSRHN